MDKLNFGVGNIPSSKLNKQNFRSQIKSSDFNENQQNILDDILNLYNNANNITANLNKWADVNQCELYFLNLRIQRLETELEYHKSLQAQDGMEIKVYPNQFETQRSYPCKIDKESNSVTLKEERSLSKLRIEDGDITLIPPSLKVETIVESNNGILNIEENNTDYMFNGNPSLSYYKKVVTDETVNKIKMNVLIYLPEDIVTTFDINEVLINPFPYGVLNITNVEMKMANGTWFTMPSLKSHSLWNCGMIENAPTVKFNFKNTKANVFRIAIEQEDYIIENGKRVFYLGFNDINIRTNIFNTQSGFMQFHTIIPSDKEGLMVVGVKPVYNNKCQLEGEATELEFFYRSEDGMYHKIIDKIPFLLPAKNILIKVKIHGGQSTPNISHFIIKIS